MYKAFFKNVIPSMFAFALAGIYAIVDGFFVGRSIGDMGLAGINIAYPILLSLLNLSILNSIIWYFV